MQQGSTCVNKDKLTQENSQQFISVQLHYIYNVSNSFLKNRGIKKVKLISFKNLKIKLIYFEQEL